MAIYSIRPKRSAIRAQVVYLLHSTMPSVTCLMRLSDVSIICRVTYFLFLIQSDFPSIYRSPGSTSILFGFNTQYRTSDVAEKLGRYVSWKKRTVQPRGKDFELILKVKMETRQHVEGQFGSEFSAICNHWLLWRPAVAGTGNFVSNFCVF